MIKIKLKSVDFAVLIGGTETKVELTREQTTHHQDGDTSFPRQR